MSNMPLEFSWRSQQLGYYWANIELDAGKKKLFIYVHVKARKVYSNTANYNVRYACIGSFSCFSVTCAIWLPAFKTKLEDSATFRTTSITLYTWSVNGTLVLFSRLDLNNSTFKFIDSSLRSLSLSLSLSKWLSHPHRKQQKQLNHPLSGVILL